MTNKNNVAKSAFMIAAFTLFSKALGFIREIMIAYRFGSGERTDAYFVAMTATVIVIGALGSALNTTLIPIFSGIKEKHNKYEMRRFLNNILNLIFFTTVILSIIAFIASPLIIRILAKGFQGQQFLLAVRLNRIGLPIVIFLGFTYVFSGYLQSNQIFGPHAIMGIPYNLVFLIFLFFTSSGENIEYLMIVTVLAALTQVLIQVPAVIHSRYKYSLDIDLKDPNLRKTVYLFMPVLLGSGVHQINAIVDKTLASELVTGSISALTYAKRINDLIISVFVMAITTVVFPMLSQAFSQEDRSQIKKIFTLGVNIILVITVPATFGILILAKPMVELFFQRGAFDSTATLMTSSALIFYSIGLVGASLRLILNKVFYSFEDTKTPMINGIIAVVINIILNLIFIRFMYHDGLALATSISAIVTTLLLFVDLRKKLGPLGMKNILITFLKTTIASLIMSIVVYLLYFKLGVLFPDIKIVKTIVLTLSVGIAGILYFILCILFKVKEISQIINFRLKK